MAECARMPQAITFGTDGWRAVIADGFTFDNVRRVSDAIAVAARTLQAPAGIDRNALVVGFDRRFLSREFATLVAETLRAARRSLDDSSDSARSLRLGSIGLRPRKSASAALPRAP